MIVWMLRKANLSIENSGSEMQVWRETGPNNQPVWEELDIDWRVRKWGDLGVRHGDVLVVQEHSRLLRGELSIAMTAPQFFLATNKS